MYCPLSSLLAQKVYCKPASAIRRYLIILVKAKACGLVSMTLLTAYKSVLNSKDEIVLKSVYDKTSQLRSVTTYGPVVQNDKKTLPKSYENINSGISSFEKQDHPRIDTTKLHELSITVA